MHLALELVKDIESDKYSNEIICIEPATELKYA